MPPISDPQFGAAAVSDDVPRADLAQLAIRAADCLRALLHEPTARAGLNETRFNVLDLLRRWAPGSCSQSEIAARLLQSESNLSTLLDRMHQDGLISRTRSKTDRRRIAIGLNPAGEQALARADQRRGRESSEALAALDEHQHAALFDGLHALTRSLERRLSDVHPGRSLCDRAPTAQRSAWVRTSN